MSRYDDMPPETLDELRRMIETMDTRELIEKRLQLLQQPRPAP
jgi:hypothetical protein